MFVRTSTPRSRAGKYNYYFTSDGLVMDPPELYKVLPYDEEGDFKEEVGGISFDHERYISYEEARKAFTEAVKVDNSTYYPPVRVEIVKIVDTGTVEKKETTINWS